MTITSLKTIEELKFNNGEALLKVLQKKKGYLNRQRTHYLLTRRAGMLMGIHAGATNTRDVEEKLREAVRNNITEEDINIVGIYEESRNGATEVTDRYISNMFELRATNCIHQRDTPYEKQSWFYEINVPAPFVNRFRELLCSTNNSTWWNKRFGKFIPDRLSKEVGIEAVTAVFEQQQEYNMKMTSVSVYIKDNSKTIGGETATDMLARQKFVQSVEPTKTTKTNGRYLIITTKGLQRRLTTDYIHKKLQVAF